MCITPKNPPPVKELPAFSIPDVVPEDFILKAAKAKPVDKKEQPVVEVKPATSGEGEPFITLDEYLNSDSRNYYTNSFRISTPTSGYSTVPSPNGVKPPRVKRRYFPHTVESLPSDAEIVNLADENAPVRDIQITSLETSPMLVPSQKSSTDNHVKSPTIDVDFARLPLSSPATNPPAGPKKRKPKSENTTKRAYISSCGIEMDFMKYGGAIDDLTVAFAESPLTTASCNKSFAERYQEKGNGVASTSVESIELGMSV